MASSVALAAAGASVAAGSAGLVDSASPAGGSIAGGSIDGAKGGAAGDSLAGEEGSVSAGVGAVTGAPVSVLTAGAGVSGVFLAGVTARGGRRDPL